MRRLSLFLLPCCFVLLSAACSNTTANNGSTNTGGGDTGGQDAQTTGDSSQDDVATTTDAEMNDTGSQDVAGTDAIAGTDVVDEKANGSDVADLDVADVAEVSDADATQQPDGGQIDVSVDVPDVPPGSCTADSDCAALNFSPCQVGYCANGMCKVKAAADGTACALGGPCGGPGVCKKGGCDAPTTCKPDVCSPVPLDCGTKVEIDLASLGASKFGGYGNCSSQKWAGPEAAVILSSAVTMTASLSIDTTGVTTDVQMFDVAPTFDGKCDTYACDDSSYYSLTVGLPANMPRIIIIDTMGADTGIVTLTLDCTSVTFCGDGACDASEACDTCAKDCGACAAPDCGNGKCDINENCLTCEADCGKCVQGCMKTDAPTCNGCACESCVCAQDSYCCTGAWDSTCVSECTTCGATCTEFNDVCGDGICGNSEYSSNCPNDCTGYMYCGDGICSVSESEDCTSCAQDCGFCVLPNVVAAGCGDGKCDGDENCTNCTADCGVCGDYTCACLEDPTCCTSEFGYYCQSTCETCIAQNGGGSCPVSNCGDGICAGETCDSCPADCKEGCTYGCKNKCGKKSMETDGSGCWCDDFCTDAGDCCSDKVSFCGP